MTWDGLDAEAVRALTGAPRVELFAEVPSVLDEAHRLGDGGAPAGTLVLAEAQSAGRGRAGRAWHSPAGRGIWLAVLLRPASAPAGGALAIRVGLALQGAVGGAVPGMPVHLKWPNDLVAFGRKAGGILCEARWHGARLGWVAAGIGLNVAGPVAPEVRDRAVALADLSPAVSRQAILAALIPPVAAVAATDLTPAERASFVRVSWWPDPAERVEDLTADGALLLRRADGSLDRRTAPA